MEQEVVVKEEIRKMGNNERSSGGGNNDDEVPIMVLNHVSRLCSSVENSVEFYTKVLGFVVIERPQAFESFDGAWLFNYGIGIHLVQAKDRDRLPHEEEKNHLDPMDNHISFQCEDMEGLERRLKEFEVKYIKRTVGDEEGGPIDQLFFKNPDGFMIEICNCEHVKLVPQGPKEQLRLPPDRHIPPLELN